MKKRCLLKTGPLSILLIFAYFFSSYAQTYTLIGNAGGVGNNAWGNPSNWQNGNIPPDPLLANQNIIIDATIERGGAYFGPLLNGGTFYGNITINFGRKLILAYQSDGVDYPIVHNYGTITNNGILEIRGIMNNEVTGTIINNGTTTLGIGYAGLTTGDLRNYGTITNNTNGIFAVGEVPITGCVHPTFLSNQSNGIVNNDGTIANNYRMDNLLSGVINNNGLIEKRATCNTVATNNAGTLIIGNNGVVDVVDPINNSGTLNININGKLVLKNQYLIKPAGTVDWQGTIEIGSNTAIGAPASAGISNTFDIAPRGILSIASGSTLTVNGIGVLNIGGALRLASSSNLINNGTVGMYAPASGPSITNDGTIANNAGFYLENGFFYNNTVFQTGSSSLTTLLYGTTLEGSGSLLFNGGVLDQGRIYTTGPITINNTLTVSTYGILRTSSRVLGTGQLINETTTHANGSYGLIELNCPSGLETDVHQPTLCQNGGRLKGKGRITVGSGCPMVTGDILPGCSAGGLTILGNLTYNGTIQVEINGTTANTNYDVVNFPNALTLGSTSALTVTWGFTPSVGQSFRILTCGSRTGTFNTVTIPPISGVSFELVYNATDITINVNEPTYRTAQSGNWNLPATWVGNVVPTSAVAATIMSGHNVELSDSRACLNLTVNGSLDIQSGGSLTIATTDVLASGNKKVVNISGSLRVAGALNVGGRVNVTGSLDMSGGTVTVNGKGSDGTNSITVGPLFTVSPTAIFQANSGTIRLLRQYWVGENVLSVPHKFYNPTTVAMTNTGVTLTLYAREATAFTLGGSVGTELFNLTLDNEGFYVNHYLTSVKVLNSLTTPSVSSPSTVHSVEVNASILGGEVVNSSFGSIDLAPNDRFGGSFDLTKPLSSSAANSFVKSGYLSASSLKMLGGAVPNNVLVDGYNQEVRIGLLDLAGGTIKFGTVANMPNVILSRINNGSVEHHIKKGTSRIALEVTADLQTLPLVYEENGVENYAPIALRFASSGLFQGIVVAVKLLPATNIPSNKAAIKHAWELQSDFSPPLFVKFHWNNNAENNAAFATNRSVSHVSSKEGSNNWTVIPPQTGPTNTVNSLYEIEKTNLSFSSANPVVFTVMATSTPPCPIPQDIGVQDIALTSATISWTAAMGAGSYRVEYYTTDINAPTPVLSSAPSVSLTNLAVGTTYHFRVQTICGDNNVSDWSGYQTFITRSVLAFTSVKNGDWNDPTTWGASNTQLPTATDDVVINHTVTAVQSYEAHCHHLAVNGILHQVGRLLIDGDVTVSANGALNCDGPSNVEIGQNYPTSPAGTHLVTVNGNLTINTTFRVAGRMVFGSTSSFNLGYCEIQLTGWSGSTPQYLLDFDDAATILMTDAATFNVTNGNGTKQIVSPNKSFMKTPCPSHESDFTYFSLRLPESYYFGSSSARQSFDNLHVGSDGATLNLTKITVNKLSNSGSNSHIYAVDGEFNYLNIGDAMLHGGYKLSDHCDGNAPSFFIYGNPTFDNNFQFKVNTSTTALIQMADNTTTSMAGTFEIQNGLIDIQGGTLNLSNVTATGFSNARYFMTNIVSTTRGAVVLPVVATTPKVIPIGILKDNTTPIYTPLSITASSNTNIQFSAGNIPSPTGFGAPAVQWTIASTAPMSITFNWASVLESSAFAGLRAANQAKVYRLNGNSWVELPSSAVSTTADGYAITANNVTTFGTFAVMAVLPTCPTPLNIASQNITTTTANLTWTASVGATGYNIRYYIGSNTTNANVATSTTPSVSLTGLTYALYHVQVQTNCGNGLFSAWSAEYDFATLEVCPIPQNIGHVEVTESSAYFNWDLVPNRYNYKVQYTVGSTSAEAFAVGSSINLINLEPNTTYSTKVSTDCGNGNFSEWADGPNVTTLDRCRVPQNVVVQNLRATTADFAWDAVTGTTFFSYDVQYTTGASTVRLLPTTPSLSVNNLTTSALYTVRVRTLCSNGNGYSYYSDWSNVQNFTPTPSCPTPQNLVRQSLTSTTVSFSWDAVYNSIYEVSYYTTDPNNPTGSTTVASPSVSLSNLTAGTAYHIRVRAYCGAEDGNGAWSAVQDFTTSSATMTIISVNSGNWSSPSTWQNGILPTSSNNVVISLGNTVSTDVSFSCLNLTINGTMNITRSGNFIYKDEETHNSVVLVNGTLNFSNAGSIVINGRIAFAVGSYLNFGSGGSIQCAPRGSNAANSITVEPIFDLSGLSTLNMAGGHFGLTSFHPDLTQPIIKGNFNLQAANCAVNGSTVNFSNVGIPLTIGQVGTPRSFDNLQLPNTSPNADITLEQLNISRTAGFSFSRVNNTKGNVISNNSTINRIDLFNTSLQGTINMVDNCYGTAPIWLDRGYCETNNAFTVRINTATYATFDFSDLSSAPIINYQGTLNFVAGKVKIKRGIFDLRNTTLIDNNATKYFLTESGGIKLLCLGNQAKDFPIGTTLPSSMTDVYTPLSIITPFNAICTAGVESFTPTLPYGGLNVKWHTDNPNSASGNITFTWQAASESNNFAANRSQAKVYAYNGTTWVQLVSSIVSSASGNYSITAINVPILGDFAVMASTTTPIFMSVKTGEWTDVTTWGASNTLLPTANDDVIVNHTVTNYNNTANCKNLTINANASLVQRARLVIDGDVTINGTFNHNPFGDSGFGSLRTEIAASSTNSPAGNRLITVSGTLTIGTGSTAFGEGFFVGGRIVFNTGSTLNINANNSNLVLTGWSGSTPQYLMDIDNLTNLSLGTNGGIQAPNGNGSQPIISTGGNFTGSFCSPYSQYTPFTLASNTSYYFGNSSSARQSIASINPGSGTNLYLSNTLIRHLQTFDNAVTVNATNSQFSTIRLGGNGLTLNGSYTLVDRCNGAYAEVSSVYAMAFGANTTLNVNVTDSALFYIRGNGGVTIQTIPGTLNMQSGKLVVKGGFLDLRNTTLTGFSNARYIITNSGDAPWNGVATIWQNATVGTPLKFDVGVSIPNGNNSPTTYYTPLTVFSSVNELVSMNLQPFTPPTNFAGPKVRWTVGASLASLVFTWSASIETTGFDYSQAKVYRFDGTNWIELPSGQVSLFEGNYSIVANGVTTFGTFAVMSPLTVCPTPQNIVVQNITSNSANVSWDAATGAVGYQVEYYTGLNIPSLSNPTNPSVSLTGLQASKLYHVRVRTNCGSLNYSAWSGYQDFTTLSLPTTVISAQNGTWGDATTWVGGAVPVQSQDVVVSLNHTVTLFNYNGPGYCKNLTVDGILNQRSNLTIGGDLTINGTFVHNPFDENSFGGPNTKIGASSTSDPAGTRLVTVNGTLGIGSSLAYVTGFYLAGRMVFNTGSTFNLGANVAFASNINLVLTGWSGSTPQYLMDIDNLTTLNLGTSGKIQVPIGNGSQGVMSSGRNFTLTACGANQQAIGFNLAPNQTYNFGGSVRQTIADITPVANSTLNLNNVTLRRLFAPSGGGNIHSTNNSEFSQFIIGNATLYGTFNLVNHCNGAAPLFYNTGSLSFDNTANINVNVTDTAIMYIPNNVSQNILGNFNIQSGKVVVKGGTLDLRNATVSGLGNTRYFITKRGDDNGTSNLGSVLLPVPPVGPMQPPVTFNLGIAIPNGSNPPLSVYAPAVIGSNTITNVSVSLQTLAVPVGYFAPAIQWNITPSGSPTLTITLTWPASTESPSFAALRGSAKMYHYNGSSWDELTSTNLTYDAPADSWSLTATGVQNFSPFAVMVPNLVLSAELVHFSAKQQGEKAELTWQTANERGVKNFDTEKSIDGKMFQKIAEVKAYNTASTYKVLDDQFSESAYYRLKINDLDGSSKFSNIVFLEKNNDKRIKIQRNTEGVVWIETNDRIESVVVTNSIGQVLKTTKDNRLSLADLPKGVYIVVVKTNKAFVSEKIFNF